MATQANTLNKLHILEKIYQEGYQPDVANRVLDKLIELERDSAQKDPREFKRLLQSFEESHQMSSDDFYNRFHKGELGDDADYFEWSAIYDMYRCLGAT